MPGRGCLCGVLGCICVCGMSGNVLVWLVEGVGAQLNCGNLHGLFLCTVSELCFTDLYATDSVLLGVFMCIC